MGVHNHQDLITDLLPRGATTAHGGERPTDPQATAAGGFPELRLGEAEKAAPRRWVGGKKGKNGKRFERTGGKHVLDNYLTQIFFIDGNILLGPCQS